MFDKFQDALVVLVFFYMVYRVGWGSGMTGINTFMLLCAVVALISIALKRTGYLDRMKEKKLEEERKLEEEKKGSEIGVSSLMLPCRRVFAIDLCL